MKLYREVLIESAEQAEALPVGTVVIEVDAKTGTHNWAFTSEAWNPDDLNVFPTEYHIALVPIEAEEERARSQINIIHLPPPVPQMVPVRLPCPRCGLR